MRQTLKLESALFYDKQKQRKTEWGGENHTVSDCLIVTEADILKKWLVVFACQTYHTFKGIWFSKGRCLAFSEIRVPWTPLKWGTLQATPHFWKRSQCSLVQVPAAHATGRRFKILCQAQVRPSLFASIYNFLLLEGSWKGSVSDCFTKWLYIGTAQTRVLTPVPVWLIAGNTKHVSRHAAEDPQEPRCISLILLKGIRSGCAMITLFASN